MDLSYVLPLGLFGKVFSRNIAALIIMCGCLAPLAAEGTGTEFILHVEPIEQVLPIFDSDQSMFRNPVEGDEFPALRVLQGRERYWSEDRHMDVVVRLSVADGWRDLAVVVSIHDSAGRLLEEGVIDPVPGEQFVLYPRLPGLLLNGGEAELRLKLVRGEAVIAEWSEAFRVERFREDGESKGVIDLTIANPEQVTMAGFPATVGVPFPRGVLYDGANVRLMANGREIPVQAVETGRWSRFGSIRWLLLDFTVDLAGEAVALELEYGPEVSGLIRQPLAVDLDAAGFPRIDAGRLRVDDGLIWDFAGDGEGFRVLERGALTGGFVEHEDGRVYEVAESGAYEIEELGAEKIVVRRDGWYTNKEEQRDFCKFITRWVFHRDSPVVRIFHTWIFTGDGNRDRIASMGWRFPYADGFEPRGFLSSFAADAEWLTGDYLVQYEPDRYEVVDGDEVLDAPDGRAPGLALIGDGSGHRLAIGAKDFWQNFPSELEFRDGALWFLNWPRHGKPQRSGYDPEQLSNSEYRLNALQARFAHEGEVLDFRMPEEMAEDPIWTEATRGSRNAFHWAKGEVETANAQGISRTEEIILLLDREDGVHSTPGDVWSGLNAERLRAVVDPQWVAASGAFHEIHPCDPERFSEEERIYELLAAAPAEWIDRYGVYGMWIFGDFPGWHLALESRSPTFYRAYRKAHHGWPYSWIPYARSGDSRWLKAAEQATRQMIDANYCHYVDKHIQRLMPEMLRRKGWWSVSPLPWAGRVTTTTRGTISKAAYLLHAWYLTGYRRALDHAIEWGELSKEEDVARYNNTGTGRSSFRVGLMAGGGGRTGLILLEHWLDLYKETFDPYYLVGVHAIAEGHYHQYLRGENQGFQWTNGDSNFLRYTGSEAYKDYFLLYADRAGFVSDAAHAWRLTGEETFLQRAVTALDNLNSNTFDADDPEYLRGFHGQSISTAPSYTGFALPRLPYAMAALAEAGYWPNPADRKSFDLRPVQGVIPTIVLRKSAGEAVPIQLSAQVSRQQGGVEQPVAYRIEDRDGTTVASGSWVMADDLEFELAADWAAGDYWLHLDLSETGGPIMVPVTPAGFNEVYLPPIDGPMAGSSGQLVSAAGLAEYWFMVPQGVEGFEVRIDDYGIRTFKASVWTPQRKRAWSVSLSGDLPHGLDEIVAEVSVDPADAGKLWRLALPDRVRSWRMDDKIPQVFSAHPARWFQPLPRRLPSVADCGDEG